MASVLHGSARTTPHLRAEFQASKESSRALAARYGLNAKTVRKWRKRTTTADAPMGPKKPTSTVLTPAEVNSRLTGVAASDAIQRQIRAARPLPSPLHTPPVQ